MSITKNNIDYGGRLNKMSKKYTIFLDIDGTLLVHRDSPGKHRGNQKGPAGGASGILEYGRSYSFIPKEVMAVGWDGTVAAMGADVRYQDKVLRNFIFSQEELIWITRYLYESGKSCNLEGPEETFIMNHTARKLEGIRIISHKDILTLYPDSKIYIISVWNPMSDEERELFQDRYSCQEHDHYYEFTEKGSNKAVGMKIILEHLGLNKSNSIAIGDSMNDMDMLKYAGISVAMGNAVEAVKEVCEYITTSAEEGGVAEALNRLIP